MKKYTPISCDFHSCLEHFAIKAEVVELEFKLDDKLVLENGVISDLFTKQGEEFLEINKNTYRLDQIIRVNDIRLTDFNTCSI